jgi:glycerol-3-phosphate dehydrogenase (NAD(P)+)
MTICILGAGAFGTALAIALSRDGERVRLWGRNQAVLEEMQRKRKAGPTLSDHDLPESLIIAPNLKEAKGDAYLIAVPTQELGGFLGTLDRRSAPIVACCKGIDQTTKLGPVQTIERIHPDGPAAMLTGPSFAADIAAGLPTALVLACEDDEEGEKLQGALSRPLLRVYRTTDVIGAELGGALKNIIALAAGMTIGAGLGDSARASIIARGFAEMSRYAVSKGARLETLHGLSGLGDLVLTCTSEKSRNFSTGITLGRRETPGIQTVEGLSTVGAVADDADTLGLDLPLITTVAGVVAGSLDIDVAIATLLARPVGEE